MLYTISFWFMSYYLWVYMDRCLKRKMMIFILLQQFFLTFIWYCMQNDNKISNGNTLFPADHMSIHLSCKPRLHTFDAFVSCSCRRSETDTRWGIVFPVPCRPIRINHYRPQYGCQMQLGTTSKRNQNRMEHHLSTNPKCLNIYLPMRVFVYW